MASPVVTPGVSVTPENTPQPTNNEQVQATPQQPVTPTPTPPVSDRQAIYNKYYGATPEVTPQATPQAPQTPVTPETPATPAAPDISSLVSQITELTAAVAALKSSQPAPVAQPAQPVAPPSAPPADWVALLAEGKREEAEKVLAAPIVEAAVRKAQTQSLEAFRAEQDVTQFLTTLRADPKNAEVLPWEDTIALKAQQIMESADPSKLTTPSLWVENYKTAVLSAVEDVRKRVQQIRAAATDAANISRREVVSSSTLAPNTVDPTAHGAPVTPEAKQPETPKDYLASRQNAQLRRQGLLT